MSGMSHQMTSDKHSKWKRQRVHRGDNGHGLEEIRLLLKGNLTKFDEDEADNTQDADGVTRNNEIAEPSGLRKLNILPTSGTGVESEGIPLRPRQDFEKYTQDIRWSKRVSLDQRYEHELTHKAAMRDGLDGTQRPSPDAVMTRALALVGPPPGRSRLECLPEDHLWAILECLCQPLIAHTMNSRPQTEADLNVLLAFNKNQSSLTRILHRHPFSQLALTSRAMCDKVDAFCEHISNSMLTTMVERPSALMRAKKLPDSVYIFHVEKLKKLANKAREQAQIIRETDIRLTNGAKRAPSMIVNVVVWLALSYQSCLFCGKATRRRAIFAYMTWACRKCDNEQWPKIRRKDALKKKNGLLPIHLDKPQWVFPGVKAPGHAYDSVWDHYYLEADVEKMMELVALRDPTLEKSKNAKAPDLWADDLAKKMNMEVD